MRFATALLLLLVSLPTGAELSPTEPANSVLLVAKPSLVDANFTQTVVLVTQAPDGSTVGVVLNRPSEQRDAKTGEPVYEGGPVMKEVRIALFSSARVPAAPAFHVTQDVYLSMHPGNIDALPSYPDQRLRIFTGFSGWAPGQLQREIALDGWYVLPVTEEILFRHDTRGLWRELMEKARGSRAETRIKPDILRS